MVWSGICILTFYLGALNTILARVAGTCTQGDASRLWGVIFSTLFYLLASYALFRTRLFRTSVIACLPVLPKNDWQAWFSIRLLIEVLVFQSAARSVLEGMPFPEDGNETAFATLWPTMSLGVLFVMVLVYLARRRVQ